MTRVNTWQRTLAIQQCLQIAALLAMCALIGVPCLATFAATSNRVAVQEHLDEHAPRHGTHIPVPGIDGSLVIVGGGGTPDEAYDAFIALAGGADDARIVVIPTASAQADEALAENAARAGQHADDMDDDVVVEQPTPFTRAWKQRGVQHVTVLHTRSRATADEPEFIEPLRTATGVWFSGGVQSRITDAYLDTATHQAIGEVLARGGVVGGTSAGAAIMTEPMIAGGNPVPRMARGLGLLPGCIVDQHALARNRLPRLKNAVDQHPGYVGFAIDEGTALVVRGRRARVVGRSSVVAYMAAGNGREAREQTLPAGSVVDLITLSRSAVARSSDVPFPALHVVESRVAHGTLLLGGGGRMPRDAMQRFVEASGGPEALIVVIPSALGNTDRSRVGLGDRRALQRAGARNVVVLDAVTPADADRPAMLDALQQAGGIWFSGGRQWRLVDAFHGTQAHQLMHEMLSRGGAIGGSSAGASIQPDYMVRGHPLGNTIMMAEGYERGLGFLPGAAVDQHFSERNRGIDLRRLHRIYPQLLSIGIDEGTVIFMQDATMEVMGSSKVHILRPVGSDDTAITTRISVSPGQRYDTVRHQILE